MKVTFFKTFLNQNYCRIENEHYIICFFKHSRCALIGRESVLSKSNCWLLIVLAIFLSITGLDFVVNSILYSYGLNFSSVWYIPYLVGISATIFSICVLVVWQSYEDTGNVSVALRRGSILLLAHIGGLIDCLYFLVYNGGRVPLGEWTWMWQYWLFGTWNWTLQVIWSFSFFLLIICLSKCKRITLFDQVLAFLHVKRVREREIM